MKLFKKHLVINYLYYSAGIVIPGLLSFLFIPFVIRNYGAATYASYSMAFNIMSVVCMFCYSWVGQSYIRFYTRQQAGFDKVISKYLWISILIGLVVLSVLSFFTTNLSAVYVLLLLASFALCAYYYFFLSACQAQQKAKRVAISETTRTAINLLLPVFFSFVFKQQYALLILFGSLVLSYAIPVKLFLSKSVDAGSLFMFNRLPGKAEHVLGNQIKNYGIPVAFFLSLTLALSINDRFIIARVMNYKTAGNYSAIYDILNKGVIFICSPVIMTFHPHIVKEYNLENTKGAYSSIAKGILLEVIIFLAGLVILFFGSTYLLNYLYKNDVPEGFDKLSYILYIGVFIWQFAMLCHKPLELKMQTKLMAVGVFIAFILNISLNYFLISYYHNIFIAAYTTLGASIFYLLYVAVLSLRNFKKDHQHKLQ